MGMLEIQLHAVRTRELSLEWASHLRLLRVPGLGESPDILPLVVPRERAEQIKYLAVSYCWPSEEYQEEAGKPDGIQYQNPGWATAESSLRRNTPSSNIFRNVTMFLIHLDRSGVHKPG
jgi:hypothetical protein